MLSDALLRLQSFPSSSLTDWFVGFSALLYSKRIRLAALLPHPIEQVVDATTFRSWLMNNFSKFMQLWSHSKVKIEYAMTRIRERLRMKPVSRSDLRRVQI